MSTRDQERELSSAMSKWALGHINELEAEIRLTEREFDFAQAVWRDTMLTFTEARYLGWPAARRWTHKPPLHDLAPKAHP